MVIGLVVHAGHRRRFAEAAATLSGIEPAWVVYERDEQIRELVGGLLREARLEGLLLGLMPYAKCRDLLPPALPVAVTRPAALDLALAWAKARSQPTTPVSIDTFDRETVDEVAAELGLDGDAIAVLPFDPDQPTEEIVAFHRRLATPYLITGRTAVAAELSGETVVVHAGPAAATIRAALHELVLRARDRQQFITGLFQINHDKAEQLLRRVPEFAEAWIDQRDDRTFLVFAPPRVFEAATRQWTTLPIPTDPAGSIPAGRITAGFGMAASARLSVALAHQAATRADRDRGSTAYLITEDGVTIGPMGAATTPLTYRHRDDGGLEILAAQAGLSPTTLARLAAVERSLGGRLVSPGELARTLGITDPSGRRLIRKLSEARLVIGGGSEQLAGKGRPARLYRLAITSALEATG